MTRHADTPPCYICGDPMGHWSRRQKHHVIKRAHGGTDDDSNIALVHPGCHKDWHAFESTMRQCPTRFLIFLAWLRWQPTEDPKAPAYLTERRTP